MKAFLHVALICLLTISKIVFAIGSIPKTKPRVGSPILTAGQQKLVEGFHEKCKLLNVSSSDSSDETENEVDEYMDGIWKDVDSINEDIKRDDQGEYSDFYHLFHPTEKEEEANNTTTTTEVTGNRVDEGQSTSEHDVTAEEIDEDDDMDGIWVTVLSDDENNDTTLPDDHEIDVSCGSSLKEPLTTSENIIEDLSVIPRTTTSEVIDSNETGYHVASEREEDEFKEVEKDVEEEEISIESDEGSVSNDTPISTSSSSPSPSAPVSVTNPSIIIEEDVEEENVSSATNIDIVTNNNTGIIGGTGFNTTFNTFNDDITESAHDDFEHEEETTDENVDTLNKSTSGDGTEINNSNSNSNGLTEEVDSIKPPFIEQEAENDKAEAPKEEIVKIEAPKEEKVKPEASKPEVEAAKPEPVKTSTLSSEIKNGSNDETVSVVEVSKSWSAFSMSLIIVAVLVVAGVLFAVYIRFKSDRVDSLEEL